MLTFPPGIRDVVYFDGLGGTRPIVVIAYASLVVVTGELAQMVERSLSM